jgi:hypothetical protein
MLLDDAPPQLNVTLSSRPSFFSSFYFFFIWL